MRLSIAVVCGVLFLASAVGAQEKPKGQPEFKVGKAYHIVHNCQSVPVAPDTFVTSCYEEHWIVMAVGKGGWLRVATFSREGKATGEYWANTNLFPWVREMVQAPAPSVNPHPKPEGTSVRR